MVNLEKSEKFSWLLVFLISVLLLWTISTTSVLSLNPDDLGLVNRFPISFWIGIVLTGALFIFGRKNNSILFFGFFFAVVFLYLVPTIIRVPPWLSNSFYPFGESKLINTSGHLVDRPGAPLFSYLDWPIFLYLGSALTLVTGLPEVFLIKYFPILIVFLYGALTFLILRVRLDVKTSLLGSVWFLASFWLRQYYFGPQSIAYVFYLLLLLVISWIFFGDNKKEQRSYEIVFLVLSLVLTLTHVLTSLFLLITLVGLYFSKRFIIKKTNREIELLLFFSVIFLSYNVFFASDFFSFGVKNVFEGLSQLSSISLYNEPNRIIGSVAGSLNYYSSLGIILINALVVVFAFLFLARKFSFRRSEKFDVYSLVWSIVLIFFGVFALTTQYGPHEGYQRAFMFGLVPLTFLSINLLKNHKKVLITIVVCLMLLNIPAQYASDSSRLATETQLDGAKFVALKTHNETSCFNELSFYVRYFNPEKLINFKSIIVLPMTEFPNQTTVLERLDEVEFIVRSELQNNYYLNYLGGNPLDQVDFSSFNKIYDNGKFSVYTHSNQNSTFEN